MSRLSKSIFLLVLGVLIFTMSFTTMAADNKIVMVATPQGDKIFETIIPLFEEANPGITVQYTSLPREQFDAWFKTRINAESDIDIVMLDPQFFLDYWKNGFLADLTYAFKDPAYSNLKRDRFVGGALNFKEMNGKIFNVPMNLIMTLFYYNKGLFEKYDIPVPETYSDLLTVKEKLEGTSILPMAYAGKELWWNPMMYYALLPMYTDNDAQEFTKGTLRGDHKWTDVEYVDALKKLKSLWDDGILTQESLGLDYNGLISMFVQGGIATVYQGTWFYAEGIKPAMPEGFELGVFPIPSIEGKGFGQPCGCTDVALSIYAKSKNKDLAMKFIDFALNESTGKMMAEMGFLSALKDVKPVDSTMQELMLMYEDVPLEHLLDHLWEPQIIQEYQMAIQGLLLGQLTPENFTNRIQEVQDQLVKEDKSYKDIFTK